MVSSVHEPDLKAENLFIKTFGLSGYVLAKFYQLSMKITSRLHGPLGFLYRHAKSLQQLHVNIAGEKKEDSRV